MANVIAEIRLAPGEVGYYDDYSRIYLNTSRPTAKIYAGMNTTQIRRSIRSGRLRLISGSLNAPVEQKKEKPVKKEEKRAAEIPPKKEPEPVKVEEKIEEKIEEVPAIVEEPVSEPIMAEEEAVFEVEDTTEETPAKPKRRRKKQVAETE